MSRCSALILNQRTSLIVYDPDIFKCSGQSAGAAVINIGNVRSINI